MTALSTGKIEIFTLAPLPSGLGAGVEESGPEPLRQQRPALNINAKRSGAMSLIPDKAGVCPAQPPVDPLILQARFINEAAALDRALAMRKALRPRRSASAAKGWGTRRG